MLINMYELLQRSLHICTLGDNLYKNIDLTFIGLYFAISEKTFIFLR